MEFVLEQYLHAIAVGSDEAMFALAGLYLDGRTARTTSNPDCAAEAIAASEAIRMR
jgi:hypothetical protein